MFDVNLFLIFSIMLLVYAQQFGMNTENYGPYTMEFSDYDTCKRTKAGNISVVSTSLDENIMAVINITVYTDTKVDWVKVHVKDGKKNSLWNYRANDPCRHVAYAFLFKHYLKTDNNCIIKAGFYGITLSYKDVMYAVLGPSFFYGKFYTISDIMSKKGPIACFLITFVIKKKA